MLSKRHIGIEIEVENAVTTMRTVQRQLRVSPIASRMWTVVLDGSLRGNGYEVLTAGGEGQPYEDVRRSMSELYPVIAGSTGTWRAAIHTHVDIRDLSRTFALPAAFGLAYCVDESLFREFSPERIESNFCVPLGNDPARTKNTLMCLHMGTMDQDVSKYTSINARAVREHGTLEFRHMKTPAISLDVSSVSNAIEQIWKYADVCTRIVDCVYEYCNYYSTPETEHELRFERLIESEFIRTLCAERMLTLDYERAWAVSKVLDRMRGAQEDGTLDEVLSESDDRVFTQQDLDSMREQLTATSSVTSGTTTFRWVPRDVDLTEVLDEDQ